MLAPFSYQNPQLPFLSPALPLAEALMQSAAPQHGFEQSPLTRTPGALLKHDMSHHFTFVIGSLQGSQEKLGLIVPKVRSLVC